MSSLLHRRVDSGPLFDLHEGRRRRDEGTSQVENSGDDAAKQWRDGARAWVRLRAERAGTFNADDLRDAIGPPPNHFNAVGAVFLWALRNELIVRAGETQRRAANAHGQRVALYVGAAFAREGEETNA